MSAVNVSERARQTPRDTLDEIGHRGILRVPVHWLPAPEVSGEPPDYYLDPKTGKPAGIVPILSELIAKDLHVRTEYLDLPWNEHIPALLRGDVDITLKHCNTPDRARLVDFGGRLMSFNTVVVVAKDSPFQRPEDLNRDGIVIATTPASACRLAMERHCPKATIAEWPYAEARGALSNGRVQAFIADIVTKVSMTLYPDQRVLRDEHGKVIMIAREYGHAAVYPGDARFLNWINNWISYWRAQGVLDYWCETWWLPWYVE